MKHILTLSLCFLALSLSAQETITYPYNPDEDVNGLIASPDLLGLLSMYGEVFSPGEIQIDGVSLLQVIQDLQNQINNNALPDGIMSGDILRWNGTAWISESPVDDECGVIGGDGNSCIDCCGEPNGDGSTCDGICGACNDDTSCLDECGVPNGDNSTCGCEGIPNYVITHEGYDYSTVQIGDQCWFSENCRYLPEVSPSWEGSDTEPYYYIFDHQGTDVEAAQATGNYDTYGVLYNWPAVMTEGICPSGWHIPSDNEWTQLTDFLGGESVAGYAMKDSSEWNGSNSCGFTGLPGRSRTLDVGFEITSTNGYWWSSSESGSDSWLRTLYNSNDDVYRSDNSRYNGFSARCVRD